MSLWKSNRFANGAPRNKHVLEGSQGHRANGSALFDNVTPGAFRKNMAIGVFPVSANEAHDQKAVVHPGWVLVKQFLGPLASISAANGAGPYANLATGLVSNGTSNATFHVTTNTTGGIVSTVIDNAGNGFINATALAFTDPANGMFQANISVGGTAYANGDLVTFGNGQVNATATISTNTTGGITGLTFTSGGRGFSNSLNTTTTITTNTGSGATVVANSTSFKAGGTAVFTGVLGGRGGRKQMETLVAFGGLPDSNSVTVETNLFTV